MARTQFCVPCNLFKAHSSLEDSLLRLMPLMIILPVYTAYTSLGAINQTSILPARSNQTMRQWFYKHNLYKSVKMTQYNN